MIIFVDSNVLISAVLNPNGIPYKAFTKAVTLPNKAVICQQNVDEIKRVFEQKFPNKLNALNLFLTTTYEELEIVPVPNEETTIENKIRDISDRPIIRAALKVNADIILTGDKDFLEAGLLKPLPMSPSQFLLYKSYEAINNTTYFVHDVIEEYCIK